jgi:hypothetical protein
MDQIMQLLSNDEKADVAFIDTNILTELPK